MAYETKQLLIAIGEIVRRSEDKMEIYVALQKIANTGGFVLEPLDDKKV